MMGSFCRNASRPEEEREVRQREHQPDLGHDLHPGADVRDEVAGEIQAIIVRVERTECSPHRRPPSSRWRMEPPERSDVCLI